jgi:hypothetical protein
VNAKRTDAAKCLLKLLEKKNTALNTLNIYSSILFTRKKKNIGKFLSAALEINTTLTSLTLKGNFAISIVIGQ